VSQVRYDARVLATRRLAKFRAPQIQTVSHSGLSCAALRILQRYSRTRYFEHIGVWGGRKWLGFNSRLFANANRATQRSDAASVTVRSCTCATHAGASTVERNEIRRRFGRLLEAAAQGSTCFRSGRVGSKGPRRESFESAAFRPAGNRESQAGFCFASAPDQRLAAPRLGRWIKKSSTLFPALICDANHRGCFPRPAQVCVGSAGFRNLGRTGG